MASKFIPAFSGPLNAIALDSWLGKVSDNLTLYEETKSDKSPSLKVATKIRLVGASMHEPTMENWWSLGRDEYLKLADYEEFEKKIRGRFIPKAQKLIALRNFHLCSQGRLQFSEYAGLLAEFFGAIPDKAVTSAGHKQHLLFHSHPLLLLRIMALPDFKFDEIKLDDLTSLLAMQWDSLIAEGPGRPRAAAQATPTSTTSSPPTGATITLAELEAERARIVAAKGCFRCHKVPGDPGWVQHIGRTCPGDVTKGITPGRDFSPSTSTAPIKKEPVGAAFPSADVWMSDEQEKQFWQDADTDSEDEDDAAEA